MSDIGHIRFYFTNLYGQGRINVPNFFSYQESTTTQCIKKFKASRAIVIYVPEKHDFTDGFLFNIELMGISYFANKKLVEIGNLPKGVKVFVNNINVNKNDLEDDKISFEPIPFDGALTVSLAVPPKAFTNICLPVNLSFIFDDGQKIALLDLIEESRINQDSTIVLNMLPIIKHILEHYVSFIIKDVTFPSKFEPNKRLVTVSVSVDEEYISKIGQLKLLITGIPITKINKPLNPITLIKENTIAKTLVEIPSINPKFLLYLLTEDGEEEIGDYMNTFFGGRVSAFIGRLTENIENFEIELIGDQLYSPSQSKTVDLTIRIKSRNLETLNVLEIELEGLTEEELIVKQIKVGNTIYNDYQKTKNIIKFPSSKEIDNYNRSKIAFLEPNDNLELTLQIKPRDTNKPNKIRLKLKIERHTNNGIITEQIKTKQEWTIHPIQATKTILKSKLIEILMNKSKQPPEKLEKITERVITIIEKVISHDLNNKN